MGDKVSMADMRKAARLRKVFPALEKMLEGSEEAYQDYVRLHRLIYDVSPDTDEVSDNWEEE